MKFSKVILPVALSAFAVNVQASENASNKLPAQINEAAEAAVKTVEKEAKKSFSIIDLLPETVATWKGGSVTKADIVKILGPNLAHINGSVGNMPPETLSQNVKRMATSITEMVILKSIASNEGFKANKGEDDNQFLRRWLQTSLEPTINIAAEAVEQYYTSNKARFESKDEVRASHILISTKEVGEEEALKKIKELEEKINAGGDFAALAKEASACPSKAQGGDLNFFGRGQMVPEFDQVAFDMKTGDVSVVKTQFGYHLIKKTDARKGGLRPLDEELKGQIAQFLKAGEVEKIISGKITSYKETNEFKSNI